MRNFNQLTARAGRHFNIDAARLEAECRGWCAVPKGLNEAHITRRSEFFIARSTLKTLLASLGLEVRLVMNEEFGFPELVNTDGDKQEGVYASWSHSEDFLAVVVAATPVGVDVEQLGRSVERVRDRICTAEEFSRFEQAPLVVDGTAVSSSLALWCAKEAVAKATGLGMRWGLKNFEVGPRTGDLWPIRMAKTGPRSVTDPVVRFEVREGFLLALCGGQAELGKGLTWA